MVLEYFTLKRGDKKREEEIQKTPVLNEQDEEFLKRIASEEPAPPLPARTVILDPNPTKSKDAQVALMDGADKIELPASPPEVTEEVEDNVSPVSASSPKDEKSKDKKKSNYWSYIPSIPGRMKSIAKRKEPSKSKDKGKEKNVKKDDKIADPATASASASASASETKDTDLNPSPTVPATEAQKEEDDLTSILDQLNLAAVNNRVFSFSKESQELMDKFKLVLKDIINGAPTAYDDLEQLLKGSDKQLKRMYGAMPPFLQALVKSLPTKIGTSLAPEVMAAMSEKPGADGAHLKAESSSVSAGKKKKRSYPPSLKKVVSQQGAVAGMLKSILNFLKLRFPAFITGTNVLMSLAVFLLLFVFWYCHKRGRETRLEKERLDAEASGESGISDLEDSTILSPESAPSASASFVKDAEPPITINEEASAEEKPSAAVADLPSVLDLPEPSSVPLPVQSPGTEKDLAEGVEVKKA